MSLSATQSNPFMRIAADGGRSPVERVVALEVPMALEFNGIGYAVLMATPSDLDDLVAGFLLSERLLEHTDLPVETAPHQTDNGVILRANLPADRAQRLLDRVRHRATDSSCGLCGIENLEQAMRPLPAVSAQSRANEAAIFRALDELGKWQNLNALTGAVHAAALVAETGEIRRVREDVGRHNAFDKLLGAMHREGLGWDSGFALLTSRCSFELVEKAVIANCPMLVTISAPTQLALDRAAAAGLNLRVLARSDALLACPR